MANILDTIIATKFEEIKESQKIKSLNQLKDEVTLNLKKLKNHKKLNHFINYKMK